GIDCGCGVGGTNLGGLPEAIGPCGITVPNADTSAMARALRSLLEDDSLRADYRSFAPVHLARHSRRDVARSYLRVLESAARLPSRANQSFRAYEQGYTPIRSRAEAYLTAYRSAPHAVEMASVASCAFWRTRNSLAAVPCRSSTSGDGHRSRRRRLFILFATIGSTLHRV